METCRREDSPNNGRHFSNIDIVVRRLVDTHSQAERTALFHVMRVNPSPGQCHASPMDYRQQPGNYRVSQIFRLTFLKLSTTLLQMATFSTRDAAKQLGLDVSTLSRYIAAKKVPAPKTLTTGGITVHIWTQRDIERVRKLLPKIKNGRKRRYKKAKEKT